MSLLWQSNGISHLRIVALMYVFSVWLFPGLGTLTFSEAALEETELISEQQHYAMTVPDGMSYIFYIDTCPRTYDVVRERMQYYISQDPSHAAGILHMFFFDCFVQGCDASVLLKRPEMISERPDLNSLRQASSNIINEIKASLEVACPGVVSCADILALAARDAIFMVGGPWIPIMTGRRDGITAISNQTATVNIPPPTFSFQGLKHTFASKGLSIKDLVALSGSHTIGQTHCGSVISQLSPSIARDLNPAFATNLSRICLPHGSSAPHLTVHLDGITPNTFDNAYFKNVLRKEAILCSDAVLMDDGEARSYVHSFATDQNRFFEQYRLSFVKMSQIGVLTDAEGEVRLSCSSQN